jgi:hypothetical protein
MIPNYMGCDTNAGRAGRGGHGQGGRGRGASATVPRRASEVGACTDLEGHIFTIGSGNQGCEIIGDFVYYLVPHGISIQVSSYRTFVLTYILAIGFKTPTRGFSRFSRNLN